MADRTALVLLAHPEQHRSRVNRALADAAACVDGVTVHDLYETYPDFLIDIRHEQRLVLQADMIVFQFPFFWYSSPALLKEWQDVVLEHGFGYGFEGAAMRGKHFMLAVSAGGPAESYQPGQYNHFTMEELLRPYEQVARLCAMQYLPPFVLHNATRIGKGELEEAAEDYQRLLSGYCNGSKLVGDWGAVS